MAMARVGNLSYDSKCVIGRGSFGSVFNGFHLGEGSSRRPVAVKRVLRSEINESAVQQEVELMKRAIHHSNILRYISTEMNDDFVFIATELCRGTLESYINEPTRSLNEWEILHQVTQGLAHLHNLGIVYRDIKPTNILVFTQEQNGIKESLMKLADFGLSKVLKTDKEDFTNTNVGNPTGTKGWMAPEVYESNRFDFKVDIWALGCIFGYTLSKGHKHPFGENSNERIVRIIRKESMVMVKEDVKYPYSRDGVAFQLIQTMLELEPSKRPRVADILQRSTFFLSKYEIGFLIPRSISLERTTIMLNLFRSFEGFIIPDDKLNEFRQLIIDLTADANAVNSENGWAPLHYLCHSYRHDDLINMTWALIQKGANVNAKTKFGESPLLLLCYRYKNYKLIDIVNLLIQNGADVNSGNLDGWTPLHFVCWNYKQDNLILDLIDVVRLLLGSGADVNARISANGETPLHSLCKFNYGAKNLTNIFQLFLQFGANFEEKDRSGSTPRTILREKGFRV